MGGIKKLLFVDTNIWLDFYRPRQSDVALKLLRSLEGIKDKIIVTHILEMEALAFDPNALPLPERAKQSHA